MEHPVRTIYEVITSVIAHQIPASNTTVPAARKCDCCMRPSTAWLNPGLGHLGKNGYGQIYVHCTECESFNVGDIEVLGIERNEKIAADGKKTGVSHKFGMLAGSGCLITRTGTALLFVPPGTYSKLPEKLISGDCYKFKVICTTEGHQFKFIPDDPQEYPLVWVQNFGKKTYQLIQGLCWSNSPEALISCTDDGNDSYTIGLNTLNLITLRQIVELRRLVKKSDWSEFAKQIRRLSAGYAGPRDFTVSLNKLAEKSPGLLDIFRLLPLDPHARLSNLTVIDKAVG